MHPLVETRRAPRYLVKERKFEVNTLCSVFLAKGAVKVFTLFIWLYMCGLLWAYTSVFSSAIARAAPVFRAGDESFNYLCHALVFGLVIVPLSCLELDEQLIIQVFPTGCRVVMLFLMLWTSTEYATEDMTRADTKLDDEGSSKAPLFRPSGMHKMSAIVVVANMYHLNIPGLSHPVADKRKLGSIFGPPAFLQA
jgi:amino acid permease